MLEMQLMAIPWEITPNLILSLVALVGAFVTLFKFYQNYNKTKLDVAKQTTFNLEKVEKIDKDLEEVKSLLNKVKNKQEVDYEYLSKIFDNLEKDFNYYREFIISQLKNKN